jgi:predicted dehydrogenase
MTRFAVIGTGFITGKFMDAAREVPGFELRGFYSRSMEKAEEFSKRYGAPAAYGDLSRLASDPLVDAVYIASPNACHKEQALMMLKARKHVLVEKPAAPCERDFLEMSECARSNGAVLLEAMRPVFTPGFLAVRQNLKRLGTIRRSVIIYCQYSSRYDKFKNGQIENAFDPTLANGALMDIGVYCARMLVTLFGFPKSVQAEALRLHNGIDAQGSVTARYNGMDAELIYSKIADSRLGSEIQGENGSMLIDDICNPKKIRIILRDGTEEISDFPEGRFGMVHEIKAFLEMVRTGGGTDELNLETLLTLKLTDEVRAATGIDFKAWHGTGRN